MLQIIAAMARRQANGYSLLIANGLSGLKADRALRLLRTMAETPPGAEGGCLDQCLAAVLQLAVHLLVNNGTLPPGSVAAVHSPSTTDIRAAVRCLSAWAPHGVSVDHLFIAGLLAPLIQMLSQPELCADAAEVTGFQLGLTATAAGAHCRGSQFERGVGG